MHATSNPVKQATPSSKQPQQASNPVKQATLTRTIKKKPLRGLPAAGKQSQQVLLLNRKPGSLFRSFVPLIFVPFMGNTCTIVKWILAPCSGSFFSEKSVGTRGQVSANNTLKLRVPGSHYRRISLRYLSAMSLFTLRFGRYGWPNTTFWNCTHTVLIWWVVLTNTGFFFLAIIVLGFFRRPVLLRLRFVVFVFSLRSFFLRP